MRLNRIGTYPERGRCAFFENIGFGELLLILIVALVIFGPQKLPELGKSLGQGIREFKKATQAITDEVTKVAVEETASHTAAPAPTAAAPAGEKETPGA